MTQPTLIEKLRAWSDKCRDDNELLRAGYIRALMMAAARQLERQAAELEQHRSGKGFAGIALELRQRVAQASADRALAAADSLIAESRKNPRTDDCVRGKLLTFKPKQGD